jgi:hypothetical protein
MSQPLEAHQNKFHIYWIYIQISKPFKEKRIWISFFNNNLQNIYAWKNMIWQVATFFYAKKIIALNTNKMSKIKIKINK